eukprot:5048317-Amphidinium_carterae.1
MSVIEKIKSESVQSEDKMQTEKKESEKQTTVTIQLGQDDELSVKVLKKQKVGDAETSANVATATAATTPANVATSATGSNAAVTIICDNCSLSSSWRLEQDQQIFLMTQQSESQRVATQSSALPQPDYPL